MRNRTVVAALVILALSAGAASAQTLSLEFHDGRVRLKAENVPVSRILAEWARVGGTKIVHGERVPGAPLTLEIMDVPERQALEIVLRGAAGYMVLARDTTTAGASAFDRILVLPTTTRAPAAAPLPQPGPQPQLPQAFIGETVDPDDSDENPQGPLTPAGRFPRGRLPNMNPPPGAPPPPQPQQLPQDDDDDDGPEGNQPAPPATANPFGVVPGGARPGTITAPPPQRDRNATQPPR